MLFVEKPHVVARLREAGFTHARQAPRVDLWRKPGTLLRVNVPRRQRLTEINARAILREAGLSEAEVEQFFRDADCGEDGNHHA